MSDQATQSSQTDRHVLAGGSGMLGQSLAAALKADGANVVMVTRSPSDFKGVGRPVEWGAGLCRELDGAASVVNLAGFPVNRLWTDANRQKILDSRVKSVTGIGDCPQRPAAWIQGSAVGFYGDRGDAVLTEAATAGEGFLADVARVWEEKFAEVKETAVRGVVLRTGVVLGKGGGAYPVLRALTKAFLGGRVGDGKQWVPWIHEADWTAATRFLLGRDDLSGPFNLTAPNPVTNGELMAGLRKSLGRPPTLPAPAWAMRLGQKTVGFPAEAVLASTRAVPAALEAAGFTFRFPTLEAALADLARE